MAPERYPICFNVSACSRSILASSRSNPRVPPLKPRRADRALPSGDFGPVDFSQGLQRRINSARNARCSDVR